MDPFSITLGVLELTGTTLKISLLIYKKLKIFRNYSRQIGRVLKGVDRQRRNFLHEVHLLLRHGGETDEDIEAMLLDPEHSRWKSKDLNSSVNKALGKSLDACLEIIEEIALTLKSLQDDLRCFDEVIGMCSKNEPLKDAVRRLRKQVKITFDMPKFEEQIKSIRELNDDLRRLREQVAEIKNPIARYTPTAAVTRPAQLSKEFGSIGNARRTSKALHQALAAAWLRSLNYVSHGDVRHNVKLLLDTPRGNEGRMGVVISCFGHQELPRHQFERTISLHVESQVIDLMASALSTPPASEEDAMDSRRKRKKVRFAEEDPGENEDQAETTESNTNPAIDLRTVPDICTVFSHGGALCHESTKCLGYLDGLANGTFRHSFFQSPEIRASSGAGPMKMSELFSRPVDTSVNFVEQLKLARNLVVAVLKFHSTPWLREYYSLDDLSLFLPNDGDTANCLQTVHLSLDFIQHCPPVGYTVQMEETSDKEAVENSKLTYGVRNLTLWSLGAVLLQIGNWSTIESLEDVAHVRRLAQRVPLLGRRYGELTKQCLECDFAFGDDLSRPRLQQAVYETVVCGLTDMISRLDIGDE